MCPSAEEFSPCSCGDQGDDTIFIDCLNRGINDENASAILESFLQPGMSPVTNIILTTNLLTIVPPEIARFPQLLSLSINRQFVQTINSFIPDSVRVLDFSINAIATIEPGILNGYSVSKLFFYLYNISNT